MISISNIEVSNITYSWKNKNDLVISNLNQSLASAEKFCENNGSGYTGPYKLTISGKLKASSTYGIPRDTEKDFEKTYTVYADDGICYIRPGVLALNKPSGWPEGNNLWPAGSNSVNREPVVNSAVFKERVGFKTWGPQKFPTTAFPEARFRVIPYDINARYQSVSDINSNYTKYETFIHTNPNSALLKEGSATKPLQVGQYKFELIEPEQGKDYIIAVKNKITEVVHYYTFRLKTMRSWYYFVYFNTTDSDRSGRSFNEAVLKCGAENIPTRAELTNSLFVVGNSNPDFYAKNNGFSRDIGSLTAEWGKIYYYAPASTPSDDLRDMMADTFSSYTSLKNYISYWYYWTKDSYNSNENYAVGAVEGNVSKGNKNSGDGRIICIK